MTHLENIVSTGRSRALPIIVVGLQSMPMYYLLSIPLGNHCVPNFRWVRVSSNPGNVLQLILKIPSGVVTSETSMILLLLAHHFNPITSCYC